MSHNCHVNVPQLPTPMRNHYQAHSFPGTTQAAVMQLPVAGAPAVQRSPPQPSRVHTTCAGGQMISEKAEYTQTAPEAEHDTWAGGHSGDTPTHLRVPVQTTCQSRTHSSQRHLLHNHGTSAATHPACQPVSAPADCGDGHTPPPFSFNARQGVRSPRTAAAATRLLPSHTCTCCCLPAYRARGQGTAHPQHLRNSLQHETQTPPSHKMAVAHCKHRVRALTTFKAT